ncbi:MAG: MFS transporter [Myxococcota bacterium]
MSPPPEEEVTRPDDVARSPVTLPRTVWVLGFGSLLMDTSSELVHGLCRSTWPACWARRWPRSASWRLPRRRPPSRRPGALSDLVGRRKPLVVLGYGLSALSKPAFPLASSIATVFAARFVDRVGKGIRGAPRDALVADVVEPARRGAAYGLRQALDSVGAVIGPTLAVVGMLLLAGDLETVLWGAVVPAALAVTLLALAVREPETSPMAATAVRGGGWRAALGWRLRDVAHLPRRYWSVVALGGLFTLARFSEAFLVLRAQDLGLSMTWVPGVLIVTNVVYALVAYPAGRAADRWPARRLLVVGLVVLVAADLVLAGSTSPGLAACGAALWGLHMAVTQGLMAKLVADTAPPALRATAFGIFHLIGGLALLLASVIAGALWSLFGAPATFLAGAVFAGAAAGGLLVPRPGRNGRRREEAS